MFFFSTSDNHVCAQCFQIFGIFLKFQLSMLLLDDKCYGKWRRLVGIKKD